MSLYAKLIPPLRETLCLQSTGCCSAGARAAGSGPCFPKLSIPVERAQLLELLSDVEPDQPAVMSASKVTMLSSGCAIPCSDSHSVSFVQEQQLRRNLGCCED